VNSGKKQEALMRKSIVTMGLLLVAVLMVSVSCASASSQSEKSIGGASPALDIEEGVVEGAPLEPGIEEWAVEEEEVVRTSVEEPVVVTTKGLDVGEEWATERMIVRTGDMSLVVEDVPVAIDQITGMADGLEGYVVSSSVWKEGERLVGRIVIRVLAEHFDDAVRSLRGMAVDVTSESTSSIDVTEEYVDLSANLQNLEATEQQLLRLMEKAETVDDILNVQRELSKTRGDIEQTKGRMQYLERTSSTSLIEIRLEQSTLDIEFTADKRRGLREGQKVLFTVRQIAGGFPPYSYEWDFGDGDISTSETPTHVYKSAGSYTVSLTVTDDQGNTDTETRSDYITVIPGWSAGSIASGAWNGLVTFGHVLADIFIWAGIFSPVWIVIGSIAYWWWRRSKKTAK